MKRFMGAVRKDMKLVGVREEETYDRIEQTSQLSCVLGLLLSHNSVCKGPFKQIKRVGQTLSSIVRWCWMVFDQCWIVFDAGAFKQIQHHPTVLDFSTRHEIMAYI